MPITLEGLVFIPSIFVQYIICSIYQIKIEGILIDISRFLSHIVNNKDESLRNGNSSSVMSIYLLVMNNLENNFKTDICIIGAGPVGLFAVFEAGMMKMKCHVVDALDMVGGQCAALYPEKPIYDIPAYPSIMAQELVNKLYEQAAPFSPTYHFGQRVEKLKKLDNGSWQLTTSAGKTIECKAIIIGAGCGAFGPNRPRLGG